MGLELFDCISGYGILDMAFRLSQAVRAGNEV